MKFRAGFGANEEGRLSPFEEDNEKMPKFHRLRHLRCWLFRLRRIELFNITNIISLILTVVATMITLSVYEFSHGLAAYKMGDDTPKIYRRLTLNPLKHIDWLGALCLAVFKFGWAKPVPVNISNIKNPRRGILLVSIAGPLSNFILAFIAMFLLYMLPDLNGIFWGYVAIFLSTLIHLNLGIGIFNLIPVPPLDGSKIVASFLKGGAAYRYLSIQRYSGVILFLCFMLPGISSIFSGVLTYIKMLILAGYGFVIERILGVL
jgi:Zn-dependent protease